MKGHVMSAVTGALPGQSTLLGCWEALTHLSPGARLVETGGAVAAVFPAWEPLNNAILRTPDASVEQVRSVYADAGIPVWALWRPSAARDLDAPDADGPLGELKRHTTTLVMHAHLGPDLRRDDAVVPASIAAVARFDEDVQMTTEDLGDLEEVPGLAGWALLHDSRVVACAWSYRRDDDCGIYAVETLTACRRRGFARRLMQHMLADARSRGARTASLQSTRMGQPLYETLGFAPAGRYEEWIWK